MICRIPFRASLPPFSMSSRRGLAMAELASMSERRPALTTSARRRGLSHGPGGRMLAARSNKRMGAEKRRKKNREALTP